MSYISTAIRQQTYLPKQSFQVSPAIAEMQFLPYLAFLTCNLLSNAASLPSVTKDGAALQHDYTLLLTNATGSATAYMTNTDHDPNINFLDTTGQGLSSAVEFDPDARPTAILGRWDTKYERDYPRYPTLAMFFKTPTSKFMLRTFPPSYGSWDAPVDPKSQWQPPERPFSWTTLTMDLPEAWGRVCEAGWDQPLNIFLLRERTINGVSDLFYSFLASNWRLPGRSVAVGVSTKTVIFEGSKAGMPADKGSIFGHLFSGKPGTVASS
ncbi:MAG: hypothetical protein Q9163_001457 [Psora crenata]